MTLQITIVEASNLPRTDEGGRGKIDPYFKFSLQNQVYQSKTFLNDLNPKYNETFTFVDSPRKDQLIIELYDDDQNGTAKLISTYVLDTDKIPTGKATIPLAQSNGTSAGQLTLEIVHIAAVPPPQVVVVQHTPPPAVVVQAPPAVVVQAPPAKSFQITIIEGKNLPLLSSGGGGGKKKGDKIDPFFKVTLGNQLYQTKIFQNEQNPKFNETFVFQDTASKRDKVNFELYNNDGGAGQLIAKYVLDIDKIPTGRASLPLQTPQGVACGQVDLEIVHLESAPAVVSGRGVSGPATTVVVQAAPQQTGQRTVVVQANTPQTVIRQAPPQKGRK